MASRYVFDININDTLSTVVKKCNANFKAITSRLNALKNGEQDIVIEWDQNLSDAIDDLVGQIQDEATIRNNAIDDLENTIELVDGKFLNLATVANSGDYNDLDNKPIVNGEPLPVTSGGTGKTTAADAWTALGGGALGKKNSLAASDITDALGYTLYSASASRTANTVLAAPNGSAGTASFRKLVAADIPTLTISKISDAGTLAKKSSGTVAADADTTTVSKTKTYSVAASGTATVQFTNVSAANHTFMGIRRLTTGAQTAVGVIGWYLDGTTLNVYLKNFSTSAQNDKTCALVACFVKTADMSRAVSFS